MRLLKILPSILFCSSLFLFVFPLHVFAAEFVQQPLFLSKSPVTEGQKVRVYAIVSNDAADTFTGTVVISADGTQLGAPAASLASGATQTVSVTWTPTAGSHVVTAQLTASDGSVVQKVSQTFTINAVSVAVTSPTNSPAANSSITQTASAYESSVPIQTYIGQHLPSQIATDTAPVFSAVDTVRADATDALNNEIQTTENNHTLPNAPLIPKKFSSNTSVNGNSDTSSSPLGMIVSWSWTVFVYLLMSVGFLIGNPYVFYSLILFFFIYILFWIYRKIF